MTENKRLNDRKFHLNEDFCIVKNDERVGYDLEDTVDLLNKYYYLCQLYEKELEDIEKENEQLKSKLKTYYKVANCRNCGYHNYDWFDDGDEFELCEKGNDMEDGICEEWRELE